MRTFFASLLLLTALFVTSCQTDRKTSDGDAKIAVSWELLTNFTDVPTGFNARFTITNNTGETLTDANWKLFFNMAPRPILTNKTPQPATVQHINGDWYMLVPEKGFSLAAGKRIDINYSGTEAVIKETDAPMGLYVVFYDESGKEKQIAQVGDYTVKPFVRNEQLRRGTDELETVITPQTRYADNLSASLIPADKQLNVIPSPFRLTTRPGQFTLTPQTTIYADKGLDNEAAFLRDKLKAITGADVAIQPTGNAATGIFLKTGNVSVDGKTHEAYTLTVDQRGITITGGDAAGTFYGVQSLLSMIPAEAYLKNTAQIPLGFVQIDDAPRFPFRGLHMDVSRNFQTKETILRFLDLLAFYKVNHFLFYTTEDEGWRLEIDGLPELTQVGAQREHTSGMNAPALHPAYGSGPKAYDKGKYGSGFYTKADFIEILKYAKARHIKVIPELNFPGHARAAIKAMEARYQRLMKEGNAAAANEYRLIDPDDKSVYQSAQGYKDNVVSVGRESTYRFYEKVVDEITKMYKEAGLPMDVMHAGGDEVAGGAWTKSPEAAKVLRDHPEIGDPKNLQAYFFRELVKRLKKRNLTVHGWEEVALLKAPNGEYMANPEFAGGSVVPYIWNNLFDYDLGYRLANGGYPVVLCNVSNFYFDLAYNNDPKEPGLYWAGFVDTRSNWTFAPYDMFKTTFKNSMGKKLDKEFTGKVRLKPEARKNIIGVEAQIWSETIKGRDMIEYYSLPKLLGFSESAWAPARPWETIEDQTARERSMAEGWNVFANTIARKDLPRLARINGGYTYRLPLPGAVIDNGVLKANVEYPGLTIRYTTDGSEPTPQSTAYTGPVKVSGTVKLKSFDLANRSSRTAEIK